MSIKHQVYWGLLPLWSSQHSYCVGVVKQPPLPLIMSACIYLLYFLVNFYFCSGVYVAKLINANLGAMICIRTNSNTTRSFPGVHRLGMLKSKMYFFFFICNRETFENNNLLLFSNVCRKRTKDITWEKPKSVLNSHHNPRAVSGPFRIFWYLY